MPQALSTAVRQSIYTRYKRGASISSLSRDFQVNRQTIYNLLRRIEAEGLSGLLVRYSNCGKERPSANDFVYRSVRCMRTWHPTWGAEKIHAEMALMRPNLSLPHYRSFYRWFHWNGQLEVHPKTILPISSNRRASKLHEIWQIDAKEQMQTLDGRQQCWLNVVDEYSGTVIDPPVFSL